MVVRVSLILNFILLVVFSSNGVAKPSQSPIVDTGSGTVAPGVTVYGAIIHNDGSNDLRMSTAAAALSAHVNHTHNAIIRSENLQNIVTNMPFPVTKWPSVFARSCPHHAQGHKSSDRGTGLSHYQIWLEFTYFDNDLLEAVTRPKPEYLTSNAWSSNSGIFQTFENGTFYKNGIPFIENDIMVIFDESARSVINDTPTLQTAMRTELSAMTTDILYLGWCNHASSSPPSSTEHNPKRSSRSHAQQHSCLYAYAVTRAGARKLIKNYELCGALSIDEQITNMSKYGWITARRARVESYTGAVLTAGTSSTSASASQSVTPCDEVKSSSGIFRLCKV